MLGAGIQDRITEVIGAQAIPGCYNLPVRGMVSSMLIGDLQVNILLIKISGEMVHILCQPLLLSQPVKCGALLKAPVM